MSTNDTASSSASPAFSESDRHNFSQWRLRLLERAAETAVTMLEKITSDMVVGGARDGDLGLTYSRIAKALRQSLALHARFEEDSYKTQQERAAEAAARQAAEAQRAAAIQANDRGHKKRLVHQAVKLALDAERAEDEEHFDYSAVNRELFDRLEDFDDYSDCGRKPVSEIVESICKVMDLKFDPALWEDEPWSIAEAEAKAEPAAAASPPADWPDTANDDGDDEDTDPFGIATGTGPP